MTPYDEGYVCGQRCDGEYDPRWDLAAAARAGTFDEFKRGFDAGFASRKEIST